MDVHLTDSGDSLRGVQRKQFQESNANSRVGWIFGGLVTGGNLVFRVFGVLLVHSTVVYSSRYDQMLGNGRHFCRTKRYNCWFLVPGS